MLWAATHTIACPIPVANAGFESPALGYGNFTYTVND